jgi:hypothetical protein
MLEFLIDIIFVVIGSQAFQLSVGIPMGTDYAPLLADLFLYLYEEEFIQKLPHEKKKIICYGFPFDASMYRRRFIYQQESIPHIIRFDIPQ